MKTLKRLSWHALALYIVVGIVILWLRENEFSITVQNLERQIDWAMVENSVCVFWLMYIMPVAAIAVILWPDGESRSFPWHEPDVDIPDLSDIGLQDFIERGRK